jgi:hypothetical protein
MTAMWVARLGVEFARRDHRDVAVSGHGNPLRRGQHLPPSKMTSGHGLLRAELEFHIPHGRRGNGEGGQQGRVFTGIHGSATTPASIAATTANRVGGLLKGRSPGLPRGAVRARRTVDDLRYLIDGLPLRWRVGVTVPTGGLSTVEEFAGLPLTVQNQQVHLHEHLAHFAAVTGFDRHSPGRLAASNQFDPTQPAIFE